MTMTTPPAHPIYQDSTLPSLPAGFRAVVVGARGGIGSALLTRIGALPHCGEVIGLTRTPVQNYSGKVIQTDLDDETSIAQAAAEIAKGGDLHLVINATGMLHDEARGISPEKSWRHLNAASMLAQYQANCVGPALMAKHFLPLMPRRGKAVMALLSARVGSISDNRSGGWHAYRAAKAGLNMMVVNFSHEMRFRNADAVVIGLHPGTVATRLSEPFRNQARHDITPPATAAQHLLAVIDAASADQSGHCLDWKGEIIPG